MATTDDMKNRLLYICHRGLVEIRLLSQAKKCEQIFDLADILELLPAYISWWKDEYISQIKSLFKEYHDKYPESSFEYIKFIDEYEIPPY